MKKISPLLLAITFTGILLSCKNDDTPVPDPSPVITSFSPEQGTPGTTVTISGRNFSDNMADIHVAFGVTSAEIISTSMTQVIVTVPEGASTGRISLNANRMSVPSDKDFTVIPPPPGPTISSFTPVSGPVGTTVTITGNNFSAILSENTVTLGDRSVPVASATPTALTITIPTGAVSGIITITVHGKSRSTVGQFQVTQPVVPIIDIFAPVGGLIGSSVSLYGSNFSTEPGGNTVRFDGTEAEVTSATSSKITVNVPPGATTGRIYLTIKGRTVSTTMDFTVIFPPAISSFTPTQGAPGTSVTITGTNFLSSVFASTIVVFSNDIVATITSQTDTELIVTVPPDATTGKITVVANLLIATSPDDFEVLD
jgi:hypothetical protein